MSKAASLGWLCGHIYFQGDIYSPACDNLVLHLVAPFVESQSAAGILKHYFFVRYRDPRPHVRLRLSAPADAFFHLAEELNERIGSFNTCIPLASAERSGAAAIQVRWLLYEREVERYGGTIGIEIAEHFFEVSTNVVLALLARSDCGDQRVRFGKAVLVMLVLVHTLVADRRASASFLFRYAKGYLRVWATGGARDQMPVLFGDSFEKQKASLLPYVESAWEQLEVNGTLPGALDDYRAGLRDVQLELKSALERGELVWNGQTLATWADVVTCIVPSYLHMTNNRLGISPVDETFLGYLIGHALEAGRSADRLPAHNGTASPDAALT